LDFGPDRRSLAARLNFFGPDHPKYTGWRIDN